MAVVTLIPDATTPAGAVDAQAATDGINLGAVLKFTTPGSITSLRYYEFAGAAGTVTLRLYDSAGAVLASATHTAVNGQSGWRNVALATPYEVTPETWYMTAYRTPSGSTDPVYGTIASLVYSSQRSSPGGEIVSAVDGAVTFNGATGNGRYTYGALAIPASTFGSANYAADAVFETAPPPPQDPGTMHQVLTYNQLVSMAWRNG